MYKNHYDLIKPDKFLVYPGSDPRRHGTVIIEPLARGMGITLGTALRRVLLSSLQGAAVTSIEIENILHEFSSIPGIREDVTDIILNIKSLSVKFSGERPYKLSLKVKGPCEVTASMIKTPNDVILLDPSHYICAIDTNESLTMEMIVQTGRGYVPASQNRPENTSISVIPIDALFTPVKRVSYTVEKTRIGQFTDYDKLSLEVSTNGTLSPEEAISQAAKILQDQLKFFITEEVKESFSSVQTIQEPEINRQLLRKIEELDLSVRSANCLKNENITYIGDLVCKTENDMLRTANFGKKSLNEIKGLLEQLGLNLGMNIPSWPPDDIEEMIKRFDDNY